MASVWGKRYNQSLFLAAKKGEYSASLIKGTAVREWVQVSVTGRDYMNRMLANERLPYAQPFLGCH